MAVSKMFHARIYPFGDYAKILTAAIVYVTLAPAVMLVWREPDSLYLGRVFMVAGYNIVVTLAFFALIESVDSGLLKRLLRLSLIAYILIYAIGVFYNVLMYNQMLGLPTISAVLDVNPLEASEFAQSSVDFKHLLTASALAAPVAFAFTRRSKPVELAGRFRLLLIALVALLPVAGLSKEFVTRNSMYLLVGQSVYEFFSTKLEVIDIVKRFRNIPRNGIVNADNRSRVHVLVLGETATRRHMSIYGYSRRTNPLLETIQDKLLIATDACSSRGSTAPALQELLSFANREDHGVLFTAPNLIEVMKAAGYKTYWISNQQNTGFLSTWAGIFANSADVSVFINVRSGTDDVSRLDTKSYDERLFEPLNAALTEKAGSKFILLHLMGSHAAYELRYPESYAKFGANKPAPANETKLSLLDFWRKKATDVDAYDNSMLYNDYVMYTLLNRLDAAGVDTMTYISDHGEGLGEDGGLVGHIDGPAPRQVYEIPLMFHVGDGFAKDRPALVDQMKASLDRPFQSDRLIHTLLDLYEISAKERRPERSLFASQFQSAARFCDELQPAPRARSASND